MSAARVLVWSVVVVAVSSAQAQVPNADLEQVWLEPAGRGSLWVGNGQVLEARQFRGGLALTYGAGSFRSASLRTPTTLVSDRLGAQVFAALALTDWIELTTTLPVIITQTGSPTLPVSGSGLGNPWFGFNVGVLRAPSRPLTLSAGLSVGVPVGTGAALGNGGVAFAPRISAGHVFRSVQVALELAGLLRPTVDYSSVTGEPLDTIGSQLSFAAAVTSLEAEGPRGEASLRVFAPLTGGRVGAEALLGVRWRLGDVELFGAAGPGLLGSPTTPQVRAVLGVAFGSAKPTRP